MTYVILKVPESDVVRGEHGAFLPAYDNEFSGPYAILAEFDDSITDITIEARWSE
jgi:hypothetical protein